MLLSELAHKYIDEHPDELSQNYVTQLYDTISTYRAFLGNSPRLEHFTPDLVNAWLAWLDATGRSQATRKTRRSALMALWRFAWEERLTDVPARCKRIRLKAKSPTAWTPEEIGLLVKHCRGLRGRLRNGLPRSSYLSSLIMALYTTGLRIGDLLDLAWDDINEDGSIEVVCHKTGRGVIRYLSPSTIEVLQRNGAEDRERLWPLWGTKHTKRKNLFRALRVAIDSSGLPEHRRGTSKWIRRAGATEIARTQGERQAAAFLDHRSVQTTRSHYIDGRYTRSAFRGPEIPQAGEGADSRDHCEGTG